MAATFTIGEFKARLPEALALVRKGEAVTVTFGRNKTPVAIFGPPPTAQKRKLGHLSKKISVTVDQNWALSDETFLVG